MAILLLIIFSITAPQNHSEAEDVYDFAHQVEQGTFSDQAGVNRVLALPVFGVAYRGAQTLGYSGRAFPFMIGMNRLLAVASIILFWQLLGGAAASKPERSQGSLLPVALALAFSYGFWRYANEAETYALAGIFILGAWCLARKGKTIGCIGVSALGILVHLLNLIPLLLIIPLFYLLSKNWKKALLHGGATGVLVLLGYWICSPWLDFHELGAQHHAAEGALSIKNTLRGGMALGQNVVGANFLFGFESVRAALSNLFPSRMLDEEFFMASKMAGWIPVVSIFTLLACGVGAVVAGVRGVASWRAGKKEPVTPLLMSLWVWLLLYAVAVIRTEAGSPELWILALIPLWMLLAPLLRGTMGWTLVVLLFAHNLIGGLMPVLSAQSDYHVEKGTWLVEHATADDLVLTSYEPIMIFYLNYFCAAQLVSSGDTSIDQLDEKLGMLQGKAYCLNTFLQPLDSMRYRSPELYEKMVERGAYFAPHFKEIVADEFGGIYRFQQESEF